MAAMGKARRTDDLFAEWEKANADLEALRARYFATGSAPPVKLPPKTATPEAMKQIDALERKVKDLWQAYEAAIWA
jgi:hypothetical protein